MEFNEKLQILRKKRGFTQEELAAALYVSRTAVSKWESGRGYPNIESLKSIAELFSVSIDELLSSDEALTLAEETCRKSRTQLSDLVFGLLDCSVALFFFLPLFALRVDSSIREVSLIRMSGIPPYLYLSYVAVIAATISWGILMLALQNCTHALWTRNKNRVSILCNILGLLLFILSLQPYAATLLFSFLVIKVLLLLKTR